MRETRQVLTYDGDGAFHAPYENGAPCPATAPNYGAARLAKIARDGPAPPAINTVAGSPSEGLRLARIVSGLTSTPRVLISSGPSPRSATRRRSRLMSMGTTSITSKVAKLAKDERRYDLLHELGTRPRTGYLARVMNPNPELA